MKIFIISLLMLSLSLLTACGGSGSSSEKSDEKEAAVDQAPVQVIPSDLESLPLTITTEVNENHRFALTIPEYKASNSYEFGGVDGEDFKLWPERGEVIFKYAPDYETQSVYKMTMIVTNELDQTKDIDITINVADITNDFIFDILEGSSGDVKLQMNNEYIQDKFDSYSFTVTVGENQPQTYQSPGDNSYISVPINNKGNTVLETQRVTISPNSSNGLPAMIFDIINYAQLPVSIRVIQWGDNPWKSLEAFLLGTCDSSFNNHEVSFSDVIDAPNLSQIENVTEIISRCRFNDNLSYWDTSKIKNMRFMFDGTTGTADLSQWDVSNVLNMSGMFIYTPQFNSDISQWDVSNVLNMSGMFSDTSQFNSDISQWDVSNVLDMSFMLTKTSQFNSDLSQWDVSTVVNMTGMFYESEKFNQNISEWDVDQVTNCLSFTYHAQLLTDVHTPDFICDSSGELGFL
jgi:surface protein